MAKTVAFFLLPKDDVVWVPTEESMRHVIERMEQGGYTAVPLLDSQGCYAGTITEGDLLRVLVSKPGLSIVDTQHIRALDVPRKTQVRAVGIDAEMGELLSRVIEQNFVPVEDGRGVFIGIVRRREILEYCAELLRGSRAPEAE